MMWCRKNDFPRSTPTRVGKTYAPYMIIQAPSGPPPRVWGKRIPARCLGQGVRSTPTRVGKTHQNIDILFFPRRSTPTRVGKTPTVAHTSCTHTVHPHACGENCVGSRWAGWGNGPPPRVWGKPMTALAPASKRAVHPHACGENGQTFRLANGTNRSTPTRVGKTIGGRRLMILRTVHPHACGENPSSRSKKISRFVGYV